MYATHYKHHQSVTSLVQDSRLQPIRGYKLHIVLTGVYEQEGMFNFCFNIVCQIVTQKSHTLLEAKLC